jgi:hypothetical protein
MEENIESIIPDYIKDEIEKYKWKKENGNSGIATYNNILALIRLAVVNNRITEQQAEEIKEVVKKL